MKVTIEEKTFETMLKATKGCVNNDYATRPELGYIGIKVVSGEVIALVCDGYSGARFKFPAQSQEGEDFTCLIKPFPFKASRNGTLPVVIELVDGEALVDVPNAYGCITYHFKQDFKYNSKLDEVFDKMKNHDRELGINANFLARIMRNFASVAKDRNRTVVLETNDSKTAGFRMSLYSGKDQFEFEQFLLPIRISD